MVIVLSMVVNYLVYVNKFWVTYRFEEFYIKLIRENPDEERTVGEIFVTPRQAKMLMRMLEMLLKEYEEKFGEIPEPQIIREEEGRKDYMPPYYVS